MWLFPWKYKESFAIAAGLLVSGILLELSSPGALPPIAYPYNIFLGIFIITLCAVLTFGLRNNELVKWLSSVPASVSAIALFAVLSLIIGFIPQKNAPALSGALGFTHITSSWQYLFSFLYITLILGCVALKRTYPFKLQNTGFILNHWGLLILLLGMGLGKGDKEKVIVNLYENQLQWKGYNEQNQVVALPMAMKLTKFSIEDYHPSLLWVENETGEVISTPKHSEQFLLNSGLTFHTNNLEIRVDRYYADATWFDGKFQPFLSKGSVPAAYIKVKNDGVLAEGWISCGNYVSPPVVLRVDRTVSVTMELPRPKKYSSSMLIYPKTGNPVEKTIEVNRPVEVNGWRIYQTGFDEKMGKWSNLSIVQAVKDPWSPLIYAGFYMLIAGACFIIWKGKPSNKRKTA